MTSVESSRNEDSYNDSHKNDSDDSDHQIGAIRCILESQLVSEMKNKERTDDLLRTEKYLQREVKMQ